MRKQERQNARFRCTRGKSAQLNALGWKVAHLRDVGLGYRVELRSAPIQALAGHFLRFMSPGNMFLVPLQWPDLPNYPR
jgi:hypothetical protein